MSWHAISTRTASYTSPMFQVGQICHIMKLHTLHKVIECFCFPPYLLHDYSIKWLTQHIFLASGHKQNKENNSAWCAWICAHIDICWRYRGPCTIKKKKCSISKWKMTAGRSLPCVPQPATLRSNRETPEMPANRGATQCYIKETQIDSADRCFLSHRCPLFWLSGLSVNGVCMECPEICKQLPHPFETYSVGV